MKRPDVGAIKARADQALQGHFPSLRQEILSLCVYIRELEARITELEAGLPTADDLLAVAREHQRVARLEAVVDAAKMVRQRAVAVKNWTRDQAVPGETWDPMLAALAALEKEPTP